MTDNNCHRHEWGNLEFGNCNKYCHQQTLRTLSSTIVRNMNDAICWLDIWHLLWTLSSTMSSAIFINNCHEHEWGHLLLEHLAFVVNIVIKNVISNFHQQLSRTWMRQFVGWTFGQSWVGLMSCPTHWDGLRCSFQDGGVEKGNEHKDEVMINIGWWSIWVGY